MNKFILLMIIFSIFLSGCVKPRIDTSSDEKMKESIQKLRDSLDDKQEAKFEQAIGYIAFDGLTLSDMMSTEDTLNKIKNKLKNKTYDNIISDAKEIVNLRIKDLDKIKKSSESARKSLESIVIEKTTLTTDNSGFMPRRILYMMIKNNTGSTLSEIAFNIKTFSPGREVPYLDDEFKYEIPGGIQAGERLEWKLQPNTFLNDEWNRDVPNGVIQIKAIACADSRGNPLFIDEWDSEKESLYKTLKDFIKN